MSLFVVQHRHNAEHCPAQNRQMAPMLLKHLSPVNASEYGLTIHGEAVVNGGHSLYLIVDAPSEENVSRFMQPFAMAGSVDILAASPCEIVVNRGSC